MTHHESPDSPLHFTDDAPPSRAQRLQVQHSQAQNTQAQNTQAQHTQAQSKTAIEAAQNSSAASPKGARIQSPGARARDMNRRIRELVREQENALYTAPQNNDAQVSNPRNTDTQSPNVLKTKAQKILSQSNISQSETTKNEVALPTSSTRIIEKSSSRGSSSGVSSWEDIADEVTSQNNAQPRRGLATGAMRGASVGSAQTENASPIWLPSPANPRVILCEPCAPDADLHKVLGGEVKMCHDYGAHYLVSKKATAYDAHFATLRERLERVLESEKLPVLSGANVEDLLFVDIETTGLSSGQPLFLIGALSIDDEAQIDLFLARDMDEEAAALSAFAQLAHGKTLVTFNGKSFDWPYIEGRSRAHRVRAATVKNHLDMLHIARRQWKHSLPNCKLQTLELFLCGRTRIDDVSGRDIPRTYHEFATRHAQNGTGAHLMSPILHHNALDILTTAELLCILGER